MLGPRAVPTNDTRATHRATNGPVRVSNHSREAHPTFAPAGCVRNRMRCGSAGAVEAQFDHAGGDLAGAVAAGVAGDVEFGGEGVEAALGGALADV